jgi:ABC-2 type transport system ATP-binding protein
MNPIISVKDLEKHFKVRAHHRGRWAALRDFTTRDYNLVRAVDKVNFEIQPGELVGYLGPNGAGKSTTLKMLTGLLAPTGGELEVSGYLPWKQRQEYVAHIGAVFGQRTTLWWDLPVIESLELLQYIYKIPPERFQRNLDEFRQLLELDAFLDTPVRSVSLGQRMRADICAALLHDPVLLFLDEPTIGLDVVAKERIRQFIQHINRERGTTIILTTHDISDVEKLCERVLIIDEGKLLFDGQLGKLQQRFGGDRQLVVDSVMDSRVTYQFPRQGITASELIGRLSDKYRIRDLEVREPQIEETIRRIYEESLLKN